MVGSVESVGSHTILRSYIWSYHFYNPSAILNILIRCNRKIVRFYDPDRDFDNHDFNYQTILVCLQWKDICQQQKEMFQNVLENWDLSLQKKKKKKKKREITSMYTANSHLRRQGEITLRTQKIKTYCHHKEPRWLYVYMTFYIYIFFLYFKKIDKYTGKPDLRSLNILAAVLSYRLRSSSVSLAIRSTWLDIRTGHL